MAVLLDGKALAAQIREGIAAKAAAMPVKPGLAVVIAGEDPASQVYVRNKRSAARKAGFHSVTRVLPADVTTEDLLAVVQELNADPAIHGILVQSPTPAGVEEKAVCASIDPAKDVDGCGSAALGALMMGERGFLPCTPRGIMELIKLTGMDLAGKRAVVLGRSNTVGKPVALMLLQANCTVTICHSRSVDLPEVCRQADILVAAVGREGLVRGDWIKPGAVVIDVGIHRGAEGKVSGGDVCFEEAAETAGWITPVPGGVGPMTIAMLLQNTLEAALI
ncbi:MAG: bifunctional 5,10-methylenetetrahydrofolate dehydrogenase/5,10-methenyltetrahydrofolate cyclohydrolase [Clostridia bacterium]|nr:bifunctional 5,10-methylenetetrahydrofolate dehydrogenase/5,10-methenyltetrahydrofolate cyclohydrolase [Clostridia bacterium]